VELVSSQAEKLGGKLGFAQRLLGTWLAKGSLVLLLLRAPYSKADAREPLASWLLTLFVMIVSGFVTYEPSGVWKAAEPVFLWAPKQVSAALDAGAAAGWIQGVWTILVAPLLLRLLLGAVTRLLGGARSLGEAWRRPASDILTPRKMTETSLVSSL
jgi:hypothetical protein